MKNNNTDWEKITDSRAERRDRKKTPKMRQRGRSLKKITDRAVLYLVKIERKKKRDEKS